MVLKLASKEACFDLSLGGEWVKLREGVMFGKLRRNNVSN